MDVLSGQAGKHILFLAEAVLVYLEEANVKRLVRALAERFPGAELVCEAYSPVVVRFHPRPPVIARPPDQTAARELGRRLVAVSRARPVGWID
jgi:O-methyltransferase involved in polyketide biosynthesis